MALKNFLRLKAGQREARLPPKCADCGTAWLYGRQRRLGICTRCQKKREIKRKLYHELKALLPDTKIVWAPKDTIRITWPDDEITVQVDQRLACTENDDGSFSASSFHILALKHAAMREREEIRSDAQEFP
jgi:hypothetical protein